MLKPAAAKTFDEYAQQVFISYISSQLRNVSRVDLVLDTCQAWKGCKETSGWEDCRTVKLAEPSAG